MAIFEEKMYGIACDNCSEICEDDEGHNVWPDKESAIVNALEWGDWIEHEDKYYCPECYEMDDNDCIIIKSKKNEETKERSIV